MKKNFIDNLIVCTNTKVTFNREMWTAYKNGDITLSEVKELNMLDKKIGELDSKTYTVLVTITAGFFTGLKMYQDTLAVSAFAGEGALSGIDKIGNIFLGIFKRVAFWIILIMGFVELAKAVLRGAPVTEIIGVVFKYGLIYASVFLLPEMFDAIKGVFGG